LGAKRGLGKNIHSRLELFSVIQWVASSLKPLSFRTFRKIDQERSTEAKGEKGCQKWQKVAHVMMEYEAGGISWEVGIGKTAPPTENRHNEPQV